MGRKPASESRAAELREKLVAWKQIPEPQRPSLRALAAEMGTSHQLLGFYLQQWDSWQAKEYRRKAREIRTHVEAESRPMTRWEEQRVEAYDRAAFHSMIDSMLHKALKQLQAQATGGKLSRIQVKTLKLLASRGYREARKLLQRINNLPESTTGAAKSFRCEKGKVVTATKGPRVRRVR